MEPNEAVYYANPGSEEGLDPGSDYFFHWADRDNEPINDWKRFTKSLLNIPRAHQLIGFYTVPDASDDTLKVMRSYQLYAAESISDAVAKSNWTVNDSRGGYVWHTTGSGKTMGSIDHIFALSVTADNINEFASRAERLSFLQLRCGAISIALDDLMVYRDYFDNPDSFIEYLRMRCKASRDERLALDDEVDHLGMYAEFGDYAAYADSLPENAVLNFIGFRDDFDEFYGKLGPNRPARSDLRFFIGSKKVKRYIDDHVRLPVFVMGPHPVPMRSPRGLLLHVRQLVFPWWVPMVPGNRAKPCCPGAREALYVSPLLAAPSAPRVRTAGTCVTRLIDVVPDVAHLPSRVFHRSSFSHIGIRTVHKVVH